MKQYMSDLWSCSAIRSPQNQTEKFPADQIKSTIIFTSIMTMNANQITLYERAGELSRRFQELWKQVNEQPGPDRPWFFHPLGYWIDLGYSGEPPEYDPPTTPIDVRTAQFAQRIGVLARTTKIWLDKEALVTIRLDVC